MNPGDGRHCREGTCGDQKVLRLIGGPIHQDTSRRFNLGGTVQQGDVPLLKEQFDPAAQLRRYLLDMRIHRRPITGGVLHVDSQFFGTGSLSKDTGGAQKRLGGDTAAV